MVAFSLRWARGSKISKETFLNAIKTFIRSLKV